MHVVRNVHACGRARLLSTMASQWPAPLIVHRAGHVIRSVHSLKNQSGYLTYQLEIRDRPSKNRERGQTLPVGSASFFSLSLELALQRNASEMAGWCRYARSSVFDRRQNFCEFAARSDAVVDPLVSLFNASLRLRQVPGEWRKAIIKPIFKGGKKDRRDPSSYGPVSLTSCVARTMEKLLNARIFEYP